MPLQTDLTPLGRSKSTYSTRLTGLWRGWVLNMRDICVSVCAECIHTSMKKISKVQKNKKSLSADVWMMSRHSCSSWVMMWEWLVLVNQSINQLYCAKILKVIGVRSTSMMSNQLTAGLCRCFCSSVLKLVRDEADCTLLGRVLQTFGAHDETWRAPITMRDSCSDNSV